MVSVKDIDKSRLPKHVAIIMDGNGRWARERGMPRAYGHQNGAKAVRVTIEIAVELGIQYLTLYAFSTENWNRPKFEIESLMSLLASTIDSESKSLIENNIRLKIIGDTSSLPQSVQKKLNRVLEQTQHLTGLTLIVALSYSSKWEITEATKLIVQKCLEEKISVPEINQELFTQHLTTAGIPDPELLIRTSGEFRISNFLLWQIAYSELYFTKTLWPDFNKASFMEAIVDFQQRERRFGKTSEQL